METPSKDKAPRKPNKTSVLLKGHAQLVTGVALSPSEVNHVASSCADGQLKIWDISSGVCLRTLCENDKRLSCVSYSKDGSRLITGDWAYTTRVWDIGSSSVVVNLNGHAGKITAARYRPDGMFLLTSSEDKSMRAWDMRKGASVEYKAPDEVLDCRWSADGQKVIAACKDASILIFDARIPTTPFQVLKGHSEWVTCVDVSEDGTQILSGSVDRTLKVWDVKTWSLLATCSGHEDAVNSCKFIDKFIVSGSGNRFWGSKDNRVLMWEIEEGKGHMRRSMLGHTDCVMAVDASAFSSRIAAGSMDRYVRVWDFFVPQKRKERPDSAGPSKAFCKWGCLKVLTRLETPEHEGEQCLLREIQCPECDVTVTVKNLPAHASQECAFRTFFCFCEEQVLESDREEHRSTECSHRMVPCPNECGADVRADKLDHHLKAVCQVREVRCSLGCSAAVVARDILHHQQHECSNREVKCADCGMLFPAKGAMSHKRKHCGLRDVACPLGCSATLTANDMAVHEKKECPNRKVACSLGCGLGMEAHQAAAHESSECVRRIVACPAGCGETLEWQRLSQHTRGCRNKPHASIPPREPSPPPSPEPEPRRVAPPPRPEKVGGVILPGEGCPACGHRRKTCSKCEEDFCARCYLLRGLSKSYPPLCQTCRPPPHTPSKADTFVRKEAVSGGKLRPLFLSESSSQLRNGMLKPLDTQTQTSAASPGGPGSTGAKSKGSAHSPLVMRHR